MEKEDLEFIKAFSKIKVSKACRYFNFDQSNLVKGKKGRIAEKMVRKYIENELAKLYLNDIGEDLCQEK